MEEPICLIENKDSGELQVNQEALNILSDIKHPVVVVTIVGLYRTGKSYLMNKLAGKQKGFSLGSTVQSHTKGIWMWCVPHPCKQDCTLILLDTEGLRDVEKGDEKNDCWIFALAVLLSSTFVYNSLGTIDQNAVAKLHYVTELTERIKVKASRSREDDSSDFVRFFPAFVWAVRDFTLELKLDGKSITENEYLENALKLRPGNSEKLKNYNLPRECVRCYFPSRKCFVFERPAHTAEKLQSLEDLGEEELEPSFLKQTQKFCQHIFETAQTKTLQGGHIVTGTLLGNLAVTYVDAIRSGTIPCLENAVHALAQIENSAAVKKALDHYEKQMRERVKCPTETVEELSELHAECEKEAVQVFMSLSFKDDERCFQAELMGLVSESYEQFCRRNEQESSDRCIALLLELSETLEERIFDGYYSKPGGYKCFTEDQNEVITEYKACNRKGIKADEMLNEFLQAKENIAQMILQTDEKLTEREKEIEAEQAKAEVAELAKKVAEENRAAQEQKQLDQERTYEENVRQLKEKMEEDRQKLLEEQQRVLDQKLRELEDMLEKGFGEKTKKLEAQIQSLQQEKQQTESNSWVSTAVTVLGTAASLVLPGIWGKAIGVVSRFIK